MSFGEGGRTGSHNCQKFALRLVEPSVKRFIKVLQIDLERLHRHKINIERFTTLGEAESVNREQINATRTVQQLKTNIRELERTRSQVEDDDLKAFDSRVEDIKNQATHGINEFITLQGVEEETPLGELSEKTTQPTSGRDSSQHRGSLPSSRLMYSSLQYESHGTGGGDSSQGQLQMSLPPLDVSSNVQAEESWQDLKKSLVELNTVVHDFSSLVHGQQEKVDRIEDNIEHAQEEVQAGAMQLGHAANLKAALVPLAAAAVGGAVLGPVGLIVGAKIGAAAAIGGGVLGFTGGNLWKRRQDRVVETELQNLSKKGSGSLTDLRSGDGSL